MARIERQGVVTLYTPYAIMQVHKLNNTRHASAGFGLISAPRRVTFWGSLV